jgi:hypothetical protein
VRLVFSDPAPQEVRGELVDVSDSGFRAWHKCAILRLGQEVDFAHPNAHGRARVMWNRILPDHVESGFVVL